MTKMKITYHRVIEDGCIPLWILAESVSVLLSFRCSQWWWWVQKKLFNGEIKYSLKLKVLKV